MAAAPRPQRRGRVLDDAPRRISQRAGVHSRSTVTYRLAGKFRRFQATIGIDDSAAGRGSVVFEVLLDGKTAYKSDVLTGTSPPVAIDRLDVTGKKIMTLSVDYATDGDILDHADWCDALLIK